MEELIKEWKEKEVDRAEFEFSCGGDQMNDTSLVFFDKENKEIIMSTESKETLDNDIYNNVTYVYDNITNNTNNTQTINNNDHYFIPKNGIVSNSTSSLIDIINILYHYAYSLYINIKDIIGINIIANNKFAIYYN